MGPADAFACAASTAAAVVAGRSHDGADHLCEPVMMCPQLIRLYYHHEAARAVPANLTCSVTAPRLKQS